MKRIILIILIFGGLFSACSDFLEPKSPNEYVPETAVSLSEMLLYEGYPISTKANLFCYLNLFDDDIGMTDEAVAMHTSTTANDHPVLLAYYSWDPDMFVISQDLSVRNFNAWSAYYQVILGCNAALDYIEEVDGSAEEKANIRAQAYTLRAYYYFQLVNLFGEPYTYNKSALGVPLKLTSALSSTYLARNTVEEVYRQILSDLEAAEKNFEQLSKEMQFRRNYRINYPAMQLLKARVNLYMENWEVVAEYAQKVIRDWDFHLYDLKGFVRINSNPFPEFVTFDNPEVIWAFGSTNDINNFAGIYGYVAGVNPSVHRRILNASRELRELYETGDLRKIYYLKCEYSTRNQPQPNYQPIGKMVMSSTYVATSTTRFGFSFRLSEAYLMAAEALAQSDPQKALEYLNVLRQYRYETEVYTPLVNLSGEALLQAIREERRRELCFEGHRWFDLRRYGMPSFSRDWKEFGEVTATFTLEKESAGYTLPIPPLIMEKNPALIQNRLRNKQ